ncbi:hypothetical protein LBMAG42_24960 [Deltaproteobacteria bacterium]|nr:hypothetical protein LBMAG42_24960 [Deltaproteobacteria bacterium]
MMTPPTLPDTAELVDALQRVHDRPGTLEIFDALIAESPEGVAAALGAFPRHPMAVPLGAWLRARGVEGPRQPTVAEVLAKNGIVDLEAHLSGQAGQVAALQRGLDTAWERVARAEMAANAYAAMLVLFAALAILGWAVALDIVPLFDEVAPPKAPPRGAPVPPTADDAR